MDKSNQTLNEDSTPQNPPEGNVPKKWWQWFLLYPAFAIALVGAIPTYIELLNSKIIGVSFGDTEKAETSNKMWRKNLGCTTQPLDPYITTSKVEVDATICESGDVFVRITTPNNKNFFEWVSLEEISQPSAIVASKVSFNLFNQAVASESIIDEQLASTSNRLIVLCKQKWINNKLILRRVSYPGNGCFDETINTYSRQIVRSVSAPCSCEGW